ncbi:MAG: hypothetical protein IT373_19230 [Polyangiaceae bacterium]|nr:hypothetical protein [Polyangiaceae bacterium]
MRPPVAHAWVPALGVCLTLAGGCASSGEPAVPATTVSPSAAASGAEGAPAASAPRPKTVPTACAEAGKKECTPDPAFAKALCEGGSPTLALVLFAKGTPWTRAYLTRKTAAWNASGGASSNDDLAQDEEVLILRVREPSTGGIVVSGQEKSYDALRWDGDCVTLSSGEVTLQRPGRPRLPRLLWTKLENEMRDALRENPAIDEAYRAVRKECKGVTMGSVSKACEVADGRLVDAVAKHVREGGKLAAPREIP